MSLLDWLYPARMLASAAGAIGAILPMLPTMSTLSALPATERVHGRVRVRSVPYNLPCDLEEMRRLDFQHYMLRYALHGNYAAPLSAPASILDVGTGTGRWAHEMAHIFPQAKVVGLDIVPPPVDNVAASGTAADLRPPNYSFTVGNILEGLPFPDASFDFVHMRLLVSAIPHDLWPFVVGELVRVTRPGGWVESVEAILPTDGGPVAEQLMDWIRAISLRRGVEIADAMRVGELLRAAGTVDIATQEVQLPCGDYGGRVGKMMATDYFAGVKAVGGVIVAQGLATQEEFDLTLAHAMRDIASPRYHCVFPVSIAYARRGTAYSWQTRHYPDVPRARQPQPQPQPADVHPAALPSREVHSPISTPLAAPSITSTARADDKGRGMTPLPSPFKQYQKRCPSMRARSRRRRC